MRPRHGVARQGIAKRGDTIPWLPKASVAKKFIFWWRLANLAPKGRFRSISLHSINIWHCAQADLILFTKCWLVLPYKGPDKLCYISNKVAYLVQDFFCQV